LLKRDAKRRCRVCPLKGHPHATNRRVKRHLIFTTSR